MNQSSRLLPKEIEIFEKAKQRESANNPNPEKNALPQRHALALNRQRHSPNKTGESRKRDGEGRADHAINQVAKQEQEPFLPTSHPPQRPINREERQKDQRELWGRDYHLKPI